MSATTKLGAMLLLARMTVACSGAPDPQTSGAVAEEATAARTLVGDAGVLEAAADDVDAGPVTACLRFASDEAYATENGATRVSGAPSWWCCNGGIGECPSDETDAGDAGSDTHDAGAIYGAMYACPATWQGQLLVSPPDVPLDAVAAGHLVGDAGAYVGVEGETNMDWNSDSQIFCIFYRGVR